MSMQSDNFHKLLAKQIRKHLPEHLLNDVAVINFLQHVHNSYESFDRDKEVMEHAFGLSEKEFKEVNEELNALAEQRLKSIAQLRQAINLLVEDEAIENFNYNDDLIDLSEKINGHINSHKITAESLSRSINLFKTLLANLQSGILVETEERKILFTNHLFCSFFNIPLSPDELIGFDCSESAEQSKHLFKDPQQFVSRIETLLEHRQAHYNEVIETTDGKILERDYIPIFIDNIYKGHLWKYTDVTESANYHKSLEESEERNRLVMNSSLDGIVIANEQGCIEYWNPRAEQMLGWSKEEAIGKTMASLFIPPSMAAKHHAGMENYLKTGHSRIMNKVLELTAVNKAGKEFPVELIVVTYQQNGKHFFCGFLKDIEKRKFAENMLKAQEEKYRNIIANMNLGLLEVNTEEIILSANQSFCEISGYDMEELIGEHTSKFLLSAEDLKILEDKLSKRKKGVSDNYEIAVKNKNGEVRWWFISGAPNYNDDGQLIGSIGIHLDITNQKKLENELEIAKVKAEEASKAKEAFLANMSHEIRTPLNAIIGMIRELGREELSPKQQTYLSHTDTAARHLLSIVNSILDISKIEAGELELDEHDFSIQALVANIISILHGKALKKNIYLTSKISDGLCQAFKGDSARLRQILINLLDNAIKFTIEGYVSLQVELVETIDNTQAIKIIVADTGIGMDSAYLEQVFMKFSQEEKSTSRRFGGTGLGMSITNEIIKLMGGKIKVESTKGHGTQVTIQLTLTQGDIRNLSENVSVNQDELSGCKVLLVEDNVMNRFIARQSLDYFGCEVDEAENGKIAIDLLNKKMYDIVLMDIQMPELDGVETTKVIRNELHLTVPIIAITANAFKKDIDLYLSIGMNDYVTKPFEEKVLFEAIAGQLYSRLRTIEPTNTSNTSALYDISKLTALSRGDVDFVRNMVDIFIEHTPPALVDMQASMEIKDYILVGKLAHRIKPSIDNMGIAGLDGVAKDIELQAKSTNIDHDSLAQKVTFMSTHLSMVIEKLKNDFYH